MGRPSDYSAEIAAVICERLAEGESLRKICKDEAMPGKTTVMRWLADPEKRELRDQYARAHELQADCLADEILEIADDASNDYRIEEGKDGVPIAVFDHEHVQRAKLRIDARKWMAARLAPKKYEHRLLNQHTGPDSSPIPHEHITPAQVMEDLASIFGAALVGLEPAAGQGGSDPVLNGLGATP